MGRQVNFYCTRNDIASLLDWCRARPEWVLIDGDSNAPVPRTETAPFRGESYRQIYLVRECDIGAVRFNKRGSTYVGPDRYWVDVTTSPVVEVDIPSEQNPQRALREHRLFLQPGYYDAGGVWIEKPPEFLKAAEELFRWVRQNWPKRKHLAGSAYVAPAALDLLESEGWKVSG